MREIIIYGIVAISSLTMIAYSVRMFIGGLVSARTEYTIMAIVTVVAAIVIALLAWDVIKRRRAAAAAGIVAVERDRD
jgi:hypothetical protein